MPLGKNVMKGFYIYDLFFYVIGSFITKIVIIVAILIMQNVAVGVDVEVLALLIWNKAIST